MLNLGQKQTDMLIYQFSPPVFSIFRISRKSENSVQWIKRVANFWSWNSTNSSVLTMLPFGWKEKYCKTQNKPYYVHLASTTISWMRPTSSSLAQQKILSFLAAPFSPVADDPPNDDGLNCNTNSNILKPVKTNKKRKNDAIATIKETKSQKHQIL